MSTPMLKRGPKYPRRPEDYDEPDESRRLAAARRAVTRERQKLGMLADVVEIESAEERVERYSRVTRAESCQRTRDRLAQEWREVRRLWHDTPLEAREQIARRWNEVSVRHTRPPWQLRHLILEVCPPPEEVERRRKVRERRIESIRSRSFWIEHVGCGPLSEHAAGRAWTCLGCDWVVRAGDPKAVEAARRGKLEYRYSQGYAVQQSLQLCETTP